VRAVGFFGVREISHDDVSVTTCLVIQAKQIQTKNMGKEFDFMLRHVDVLGRWSRQIRVQGIPKVYDRSDFQAQTIARPPEIRLIRCH